MFQSKDQGMRLPAGFGLRCRIFFCLGVVLVLTNCSDEPGRIRANKAELCGVYEAQFGNGIQRLELRSDQTYVQDYKSPDQTFHHVGNWKLEYSFLDGGSNVVLISSIVSGPTPAGMGERNLIVHRLDGHLALAINESADWYFVRIQ